MTKNHAFLSSILLFSLSMMLPVSHAESTVNPADSAPITTPAAPAEPSVTATTAEPAAASAPTTAAPAATPTTAAQAPSSATPPAATPTTADQTPASTTPPAAAPDEQKKTADKSTEGKKLVARVVWVKGTLNANLPGADVRSLKKADNIYMNDTLTTANDSEAQIVFTDNSTMAFRPESKLYINEYNYSPKTEGKGEKKSAGKYIMDLVTGGFRTITGLVAKDNPNDYQVNTPVATIGVRGTEYSVVYKVDGGLYIKRYKGTPCMSNGAGGGKGASDTKSKGGGGDAAASNSNEVCLDKNKQYGQVTDAHSGPVALVQQPEVFRTDVEVVPFSFSDLSAGVGPNSEGGGSSFCIQ